FFFSSRRRHTRCLSDWSSDVCSSDLVSSTLDLKTVLTTIVSRANQLSGTDAGAIYEFDEAREEFYLLATQNLDDEFVELLRATRSEERRVGKECRSWWACEYCM